MSNPPDRSELLGPASQPLTLELQLGGGDRPVLVVFPEDITVDEVKEIALRLLEHVHRDTN